MKPAHSSIENGRLDEGESGAILVELALVLPLLVLFLLTVVDLGLVIREHQIIQNAAREGARYSILPTSWIDPRNPGMSPDAIRARVLQYLAEEGITPQNTPNIAITISQGYPIDVGGITIFASRVTVTYDRTLALPWGPWGPWTFFGSGAPAVTQLRLSGSAVFRNLF